MHSEYRAVIREGAVFHGEMPSRGHALDALRGALGAKLPIIQDCLDRCAATSEESKPRSTSQCPFHHIRILS
jgi:hypothetical protein